MFVPCRMRLERSIDLPADLAEGLLLKLTNPLTREIVFVANLFEREFLFIV